MRLAARFGALLCAASLAACAITPNSDVMAFAADSGAHSFEVFDREVTSSEALVLPVVHDRQTSGPACGAHVLASVVNYWKGAGTLDGQTLFDQRPPASPSGYSMAELLTLAREHGLLASPVRLPQANVIRELENGRPVLLPVRLPSIYVQQRTFPGADVPVVGLARSAMIGSAARFSEGAGTMMVDHYLLAVGYDGERFVVVEPVMGYRTISFARLARYREHFGNAAIVFSAAQRAQS